MKIHALLSLSVVNIISVVVLPSLSRVAFNFVTMNFNYSYFFKFCGPAVTGSRCCVIPVTFSVTLFDYPNVAILIMLAKTIK